MKKDKTVEQIEALYLDQGFDITKSPIAGERVFRINLPSGRHYRRESGKVYKSLTTFLSAVEPRNKFLETWRDKMADDLGSSEKVETFVQNTADYGTILHIHTAEFAREKKVDWSLLPGKTLEYLEMMDITGEASLMAQDEMTRDFASICQFFFDFQVKIIAVELPVFMEQGIATLIDIVCEMNEKNYTDKTPPEKRKRVKAIINLKSGKNGSFYETHVMQLIGERRMFNETYGHTAGTITEVYNLSPKDWRETPTYTLKNQTDAAEGKETLFGAYLMVADSKGLLSIPTRTFPVFSGVTNYGEDPSKNITLFGYSDYSDYIILNHKRKEQ